MPADYDLVILGGTLEGRMAATRAVGYGARVALVEVPGLFERNQQQRYLLQGLQQLGRGLQQQGVGQLFGLGGSAGRAASGELNWAALLEWSAITAQTQCAHLSADVMSTSGVDVIFEVPERLSRTMVVTTASRRLRSLGVLAAYGLSPDVFDGLLNAPTLPNTVEIWGGGERSMQWAEALSTLGAQVFLQTATVLPGWDGAIQGLVRSQLIAKGIQFVEPDTPKRNPIQADVTLKFGTEQPALTLPPWIQEWVQGNQFEPTLTVNRKLQTQHPRVFACGALLGGSPNASLAQYEAKIALANALFLPKNQVDYSALVHGNSQFAKVGCTEAQAQQQSGTQLRIWEVMSANSTDLSRTVPQPGYCKLVCLGDRLVGVHLYGDGANDWAMLLAPALGQSMTSLDDFVGDLADGASLGGLIASAVGQAQQRRWQPYDWRRDWAENWFNWRRSR